MSKQMTDNTPELDVREIEGPPFTHIMSALDDLAQDESLRLIAGFEPVPLYDVLEEKGFVYETEQRSPGQWNVLISHA